MKQDPSRGGGSTLSPAYSAALQQLVDKRTAKKPSTWDNVLGGLKGAAGLTISPLATAADIVAKPFELIPGVPDVNPESVGSVNLFVQGGKSLQHVTGDAKELGRSIITGKDTLSQSPTAQAYQAAGGGLTGTLAAAGPYLDLASVFAPVAMGAARGAGVVAPKAVPYKPLTNADIPATPYRTTRNALAEDMAQAQQNVVPLFPEQPPSPSRLRVTNAKLGQSDVADLASYREARDPNLRRFNKNAGDDLYPVGTEFVGKPGTPGRDEAMRNFNAFSQVYEFKFDPKDGIDIEDFIKEGVSAEDYDLFTGLLSRAESYKIPRSEQFKVALANFVQRMGGDAVIVNDELIRVPRGKMFKDYLAEDEFGLSAIDITPTNRRTLNPRQELAQAQAQLMTPDELGELARTINADAQITGGQNKGLSYFWGGEPMINDRLRGDYLGDAFDAEIAEAQAFFQRVPPLQQPVKVFRGIMVEEPEAGTNAYSDFVRTWKPGDVIEEPGFMSTTIDRKIAEGYSNAGRILEIEVPEGTRVATPEMFGDAYKSIEQELTLPPNTKLQITSVSNDVIKARVVPSNTPTTKRQTVRDALLRYVDPERS